MARARSALPLRLVGTLALALLAAAPGCRRRPSPAYGEASALFSTLTNQLGEDAFGDPRMDEVERLLASVPENSLDAPAAAELRKRIAEGRAAFQRDQEARAAAGQPAGQAEDPWANWRPPPEPPDAGTGEDAGSGMAHPDVGMTVEELKARFSDCFSYKQNIVIPDHGRHDIWEMAGTAACREQHPGLVQRLLVLDTAGKKIMATAPASALEVRYYYPDGGEAPAPPN